ncbi:MAG: protein-L-isoaspartate(D-aspartate) O-methyltransferase [bacterium]|nr:MAG: protein-L-isoaspartate(D-aspartate) O-methyltransferase [bacterium]KAF0148973.1 MAG: protein-L-isoaspartate(D-aspartate) O-methyltransferase [bacterium]KAF0168364.1 MAG: protein-L-isoaspartate(D-aspartate) O-methyltransferase [bacterium]TXT21028.1 MAG: protein-L-isoaspartate(D-aspartate) O-methyltransferase [bacterium]
MDMDEREGMLRDIRREAELTHHWLGKDVIDARVMAAIAAVPREAFVPPGLRPRAFDDGPLPIGHGQTISQPFIVALMTDLLRPRAGDTVLEIGCGSGYQAAVLSRLVRRVYSLEIIPEMAAAAAARLAELGYDNVEVRHADGYAGLPEHAPYDGILVTAAAPHVPPALTEQLAPGARLVIPVGRQGWSQELRVLERRVDGGLDARTVLDVAFVPLTGPHCDGN